MRSHTSPSASAAELSKRTVLASLCELAQNRLTTRELPTPALVRVVPDLLSVALAGSFTGPARILGALSPSTTGRSGNARVWGQGRLTDLRDAVACNAFAAHVLDFDDDETELAMAHMSVTVVSAALTLCDALPRPITGSQLFAAISAGYDIALALGKLVNPDMYRAGWHATAVLGPFASAVACGGLLGLDTRQMANALALSASLSGGIRGAFGGDGKPLQVAQAAASGLFSAQLAAKGFSAPMEALEGPRGFLGVHRASTELSFTSGPLPPPGFVVKAYPTCTATHAAIAALLDALAELPPQVTIVSIHCQVDPFVPKILLQGTPVSGDEARFNMAYCLARAALDGRLGPDAFRTEALRDPAALGLMGRVHVDVAMDLPKGPSGVATGAHIAVHAANGQVVRKSRLAAPGSEQSPLSDPERLTKFALCLSRFCSAEDAAVHFDALLELPNVPDVRAVLDPLFDLTPFPSSHVVEQDL